MIAPFARLARRAISCEHLPGRWRFRDVQADLKLQLSCVLELAPPLAGPGLRWLLLEFQEDEVTLAWQLLLNALPIREAIASHEPRLLRQARSSRCFRDAMADPAGLWRSLLQPCKAVARGNRPA